MLNRRIGHYRLTELIGEGGMGVVYLAEREDEFRQRVAIKLLRCAGESQEVMARFRAERQTLAALNHPNVVALLDGGSTEDGLQYLVMERVEGTPIDQYCATHALDLTARLHLFLQVCAAVQYAHQNLVVHCDLKPSNILVTAEGVPKLLDFGIAKLLAPQRAAAAYKTVGAQRPFTPEFASPEQFLGKPVTTATDIYGLGMILFRLLTDGSPYHFETHSDVEMISAVCVQEPQRPSAVTSNPAKRGRLEGDLDAIVLKALRKEPQERYGSVEHLAEDIRRHLDGRPVMAHRGTLRYRALKFAKRNRVSVAAAAVVLLAVVGGVAGITWEAGVAMAARARAERRFQDVQKLAKFMLFDFHDAVQKLPGSTPVQQMLVERSLRYLDSLAQEAHGDPELELDLVEAYVRLGDVQGNPYKPNLGDTAGALASYRKALAIGGPLARERASDPKVAQAVARVHSRMGDVLMVTRQTKEAAAEARLAVEALDKVVAAHPADVEARVELASSLEGLGDQLGKALGDRGAAQTTFRKSLGHWEAVVAADPNHVLARRAVAVVSMKLADIESAQDPRGALDRLQKALTILAGLPAAEQAAVATRRVEASIRQHIADCQWALNDTKGAIESYQQAIGTYTGLVAHDPTNARAQYDLVVALNNVGETYEAAGDTANALRSYGQVTDGLEGLIRLDSANLTWRAYYAEILVRVGRLLEETGQGAEARRQTAKGLDAARRLADEPGASPENLVRAARVLVLCEPKEMRDAAAALRYAQHAVELTSGSDAYALDTLAEAQIEGGNREAAAATVQRALALTGTSQASPWVRKALETKLERVKK